MLRSISTRDNFTSPKNEKSNRTTTGLPFHQCYVEEQSRSLNSFVLQAFKTLRSLHRKLQTLEENKILQPQPDRAAMSKSTSNGEISTSHDKMSSVSSRKNMLIKKAARKGAEKRALIKEFTSEAQIEELRKSMKYKYQGRNVLGVRNIEDWINTLEIGNVMQLNPMNPRELTQKISNLHEMQKDPMLEKLVLLIVGFFSIATEMRLMAGEAQQEQIFKESELWHTQSVFFGSYYLPQDCPLVIHVIQSYLKHYPKAAEAPEPEPQIIETVQIDSKRKSCSPKSVKKTKPKPPPLELQTGGGSKTKILKKYIIKKVPSP